MQKIKKQFVEFFILLKSVPPVCLTLFVLSVVAMNLLANKSINLPVDWLALDCGIVVSWITFLSMDVLTKHFGPKAATELSVFAMLINLAMCLLFFVVSVINGVWSASYVEGGEQIINSALDKTFGGVWYVVLGSAAAFVASAFVNNFVNFGLGKLFYKKPDGIGAFLCRTYVSTMLGQFVDNFVFALIVSHFFFDWSILQCVTCALAGMVVELMCELLFAPLGYRLCNKWKKQNVGREYFEFKETCL